MKAVALYSMKAVSECSVKEVALFAEKSGSQRAGDAGNGEGGPGHAERRCDDRLSHGAAPA